MKKSGLMKIIVVDDVVKTAEAISLFVEEFSNFEVIATAHNAKELLFLPQLKEADVVLLDIQMPHMTGVDIAKTLNYRYPHLKLIAVTMYQDNVYQEEIMQAGFHGYVHKSRIAEDLMKVITEVLKGKFVHSRGPSKK
jgi:DNA-binding NarL/FixJ family response regulator